MTKTKIADLTLDQAFEYLRIWVESGCIGNMSFYRGPNKDTVRLTYDRTVKPREVSEDVIESAHYLMSTLGGEKIVIEGRQGAVDLLRVTAPLIQRGDE